MQEEAIRLYCGIGETEWNHYPVMPGLYSCISPVYGNTTESKRVNHVSVPIATKVIQDSGAFSDGPGQRLNFKEALHRQEKHAKGFHYTDQIETRASYDLLIDEMWSEDEATNTFYRAKKRWSETEAELAVQETIAAARYLGEHRNGFPCVLSAQGVSPQQYLKCSEKIVPFLQNGDIFGLGGWCITGRLPAQMSPVFYETMALVIPFLGKEGVKRAHIWGVCFAEVLGFLLWLCDQYSIELSTDSVGPSIRPARGHWGYANWTDSSYHSAPPKESVENKEYSLVKTFTGKWVEIEYTRGIHRAEHVQQVRDWFSSFRKTVYYPKAAPLYLSKPHQLLLAM